MNDIHNVKNEKKYMISYHHEDNDKEKPRIIKEKRKQDEIKSNFENHKEPMKIPRKHIKFVKKGMSGSTTDIP